MKNIVLSSLLTLSTSLICTFANASNPTGFEQSSLAFSPMADFSDEFNANQINTSKWENAPKSLVIGAWSFVPENTYVKNGVLNIDVTQETHTRPFHDSCWDGVAGGSAKLTQRELYYKSGAIRTAADTVYGFYEAKIKGVKMFPGLSPAFWLYSDGHPFPDSHVEGSVDYSEIDIVELQQADWHGPKKDDADPVNVMDHNLHARIVGKNGKKIWRRPKAFRETQLLNYHAPFDPSEDFHTYAVENRKDRIFWYVDGNLVGSKANLFWHRPMHLILSMGLRRHFIKFNGKCQRADPHPDNVTKKGFPEDANMQIEYVRSWQIEPSIWLASSQMTNQSLALSFDYHAGSTEEVIKGNTNGIELSVVEVKNGKIVKHLKGITDKSVLDGDKKYAGSSQFKLDLAEFNKPLTDLAVIAMFSSSNGNEIQSQLIPISNL
ncbi:family 16 glycosylhydrolase [Catenovulum maritimum]|uniref:family 16 glycosylhydrolase n=1 Tax=Catenovulum maritimum TaxID=1513271 RepID=UPI00098F373F|nr:family 16 glycosylhydrolase [Catenovulum maritimum]